ncbi:MAG: hypothetical protein ACLFVH_02505 [Phycisphaerae bacterium]
MSGSAKALVFLRHNNDVDQIVPVLWKWLTTSDVCVKVVLSGETDLSDDYRIEFLRRFDRFEAQHIYELLAPEERSMRKGRILEERRQLARQEDRRHRMERIDALPRFHPRRILRGVLRRMRGGAQSLVRPHWSIPWVGHDESLFARIIEQELGDVGRALLVFDWISDNMVDYRRYAMGFMLAARRRGIRTVSLPHGDEPHACWMTRRDELDRSAPDIYSTGAEFSAVVVPNELCQVRYLPHMPPERVPVLGSARYNKEWVSVIDRLLPEYDPVGRHEGLHLVMYLRHFGYPLFWDEIVRTIQMVTRFPDVHLVVVHHPRHRTLDPLIQAFPDLATGQSGNVSIVSNVPSGSLIRWADAVLDLGTSAVFEAVRLNKPILSMEYLHATYTTVSRLMPKTICHCRDHVLDAIEALRQDPSAVGLDPVSRRRFLSEVVDVPDENVLPRYVEFLNGMLHGGPA